MNNLLKYWQWRSKRYGDRIEGVLFKSFPSDLNAYLHNWEWREMKKELESVKGKKIEVLDVGCGYGRLSREVILRYKKARVWGVDISSEYVKMYNSDLSPRGKAKVADMRKLPFKDGQFDVVIVVTVFLYMCSPEDQQKAIAEMFRVLKRKGLFMIVERHPVGQAWVTCGGMLEGVKGKVARDVDTVSFKRREMKQLLTRGGGKTEEVIGMPLGTLLLPFLAGLGMVSASLMKQMLKVVEKIDKRIGGWGLPSLYYIYKGKKS